MSSKLMKKLMALTISTITIMGISAQGASAEWRQGRNGWWNAKGQNYSVGWEQIGGSWFFFDKDGYMKTGWISDGGRWYFLNPNGYMATGWLSDGTKWYYLNPNGDMAANTNVGGYQLGPDGAWIDTSNINATTGAAVQITTGPSVIIIPENNSHLEEKQEKEKERLGKLLDKLEEKEKKRIEKYEDKEEKYLKHFDKWI